MKYYDIAKLTAADCNAQIRQCQKDMSTANADQRDHLRNRIAILSQHAAFMNRNVVKVTEQEDKDSGFMQFMGG